MLVMLDAIQEKFKDETDIWKKLTEDKLIKFYFLPIRDMGETDDLYIRMNLRGKPLTKFEHFKAELEKCISKIYDRKEIDKIMRKIDLEWTDMLWTYCEKKSDDPEKAIIDDKFISFFYFVCDILYYKAAYKDNIPNTRKLNELNLLKQYFCGNNAEESIKTLVSFFDCWCNIPEEYKTSEEFLKSFLSSEHQYGKVITSVDIFKGCLTAERTFEDNRPKKNIFSLGNTVRLYAVTLYLLNTDKINKEQFVRRFRSVNNLVLNSENELADRTYSSHMPGIIKQTQELVLKGTIDKSITGFNNYQVNEEIAKFGFTEVHPDKAELLFELEDHPLLNGQIGIVGLDNIDYTKRFESLFKCNYRLVSRALMSVGNYGQKVDGWYYQYGTYSAESWKYMFHIRRDNENSYKNDTHNVLLELLKKREVFDNNLLEKICNEYVESCEKLFPWRYYYVKYSDIFAPSDYYGRYYNQSGKEYDYIVTMTKRVISVSAYNPFLEYFVNHSSWVNYQYNSIYHMRNEEIFIEFRGNNEYRIMVGNFEITVMIKQNNGIDTDNRILVLKNIIEKINDASDNNTLENPLIITPNQ